MHGYASAAGSCHPTEDRKFTIAELKRITSVPDDFVLTGTFAQRWERLGRMVPPIMMREISRTIKENILDKL
jgi:DNA (cytosine-5)-methyltransferase 1